MPQDISPSVELRERLDDLVRRAIAAGADAADAVMFESASLSVAQRLGVSEGIERAESQDLGLRVFRGRRQAVVSSTDVSADALAGLIERAMAMAGAVPEDPFCGLADRALLAADIPIVEHLTNLAALPGAGSHFFAVPVKVRAFGTFPVRAFAKVENA